MNLFPLGHKCHKVTAWLYNDTCAYFDFDHCLSLLYQTCSIGWTSLPEHIPAPHLTRILPGRLFMNDSVHELLGQYARTSIFYHQFMEDTLESSSGPEYWEKTEWVCGDCVVRLLKARFYDWFLDRLAKGKLTFILLQRIIFNFRVNKMTTSSSRTASASLSVFKGSRVYSTMSF